MYINEIFNFPVEIKGEKELVQCISFFQWKIYPMAYTYVSYMYHMYNSNDSKIMGFFFIFVGVISLKQNSQSN